MPEGHWIIAQARSRRKFRTYDACRLRAGLLCEAPAGLQYGGVLKYPPAVTALFSISALTGLPLPQLAAQFIVVWLGTIWSCRCLLVMLACSCLSFMYLLVPVV